MLSIIRSDFKKNHNNHKPLFGVYLLPQKILDQTHAVHLLQESIGLFYSCGATGVLRMERDTGSAETEG